jgi:hypothetical protein
MVFLFCPNSAVYSLLYFSCIRLTSDCRLFFISVFVLGPWSLALVLGLGLGIGLGLGRSFVITAF